MTFHKAKEEYKWKQWKEQEEKILRESGVSEEVIQRIRELDWQDFNADRRFWEHFSSNQEELYTACHFPWWKYGDIPRKKSCGSRPWRMGCCLQPAPAGKG